LLSLFVRAMAPLMQPLASAADVGDKQERGHREYDQRFHNECLRGRK